MELSNRDVQNIQASFFKIEDKFSILADHFYLNLFESRPDLRQLFPENLADQKKKLIAALGIIINGCSHFDSIQGLLQELGERHITYGVAKKDYDDVRKALILALQNTSGDDWNNELEQAWFRAYSIIEQAMTSNFGR